MHRTLTCPSGTSDIGASNPEVPEGHLGHRCIERSTAPGAPRTSTHRTLTCPRGTSDIGASNPDVPLGHLGPRCIEAMGWPRGTPNVDASNRDVPEGQVEARCIDVRGARGPVWNSVHRTMMCPRTSLELDASRSRVPRGHVHCARRRSWPLEGGLFSCGWTTTHSNHALAGSARRCDIDSSRHDKGNVIQAYEPYYSSTPEYEDEAELVEQASPRSTTMIHSVV
jgi:hypothetical protein